MILDEIKTKLKAYKKEVCLELGVNEDSIRLCKFANMSSFDENNELTNEIKATIRQIIEDSKKAPKNVPIEVKNSQDTAMKKMTITFSIEVEIPENIDIKNVENLYSKLAKEHFRTCKDIVCHTQNS